MKNKGVPIRWANYTYFLTYEKAIIFDKSKLFILSQNLTTPPFIKNREFNVLDTNVEDVKIARNIFIADWEKQRVNYLK